MAIEQRTTGITNASVAIAAGKASRYLHILGYEIMNPNATPVVVDIQEGVGGTIRRSHSVPPGDVCREECEESEIGSLILYTAGAALAAQCRVAVSAGLEIVVLYGRV